MVAADFVQAFLLIRRSENIFLPIKEDESASFPTSSQSRMSDFGVEVQSTASSLDDRAWRAISVGSENRLFAVTGDSVK